MAKTFAARGNILGRMGKYAESVADSQKALPEMKANEAQMVVFNLAQAQERLGQKEQARENYVKALSMNQTDDKKKKKATARANGDWSSYPEWL